MQGSIYQINVKPSVSGERGIPKSSVGHAYLSRTGVTGDYNLYRTEKKDGTLDRAVLVIPLETITQLADAGWSVQPGDLGENITTQGIPYGSFAIGSRWKVDEAMIQISEVCKPCKNLRVLPYVGLTKIIPFVRTLVGRRGWYARVLKEGNIRKDALINYIE